MNTFLLIYLIVLGIISFILLMECSVDGLDYNSTLWERRLGVLAVIFWPITLAILIVLLFVSFIRWLTVEEI